jgi:hypothetical protein
VNRRIKAAAATVVLGLAVVGGGSAYAATREARVGPPTQNPAFGEYNYAPGAVVYFCVSQATQEVRVETRTDTPDNCAAGEVQGAWVIPTPYPIPSSAG